MISLHSAERRVVLDQTISIDMMNTFAGIRPLAEIEYAAFNTEGRALWDEFLRLVRFEQLPAAYTELAPAIFPEMGGDVGHIAFRYRGKTISLGYSQARPGTTARFAGPGMKDMLSAERSAMIVAGEKFADHVRFFYPPPLPRTSSVHHTTPPRPPYGCPDDAMFMLHKGDPTL